MAKKAEAYKELRDTLEQIIELERLATLRKFASDMAHEIRNPLQAIMTFFDLLPEKYNDPEFRERFSRIAKREVGRINRLVQNLSACADQKPPTYRSNPRRKAIRPIKARSRSR